MNEKVFDRSVCFTYFGNYYKQVTEIEKQFGIETAYQVERAIVEYGLFQQEITDPKIKIFVGLPTLDLIDSSQSRRAKGFGEDKEKTKKVEDYYLEHPNASQNEISKATGVSKGKVNKVLKILKANASVNVNNFDNDNYNDSMTVTGDRIAECHTMNATLKEADASTPPYAPISKYQQALLENKERAENYKSEYELYKKSSKIINLYREYVRPRDIKEQTGYDLAFINQVIDKYKEDGYKKPNAPKKPKNFLKIPTQDGEGFEWDFDACYIEPEDVPMAYQEFIDPDKDYGMDPEFVTEWFKDAYGYIAN